MDVWLLVIKMPIVDTKYILHPKIYVMKYCHWMIEVWMKNCLVSDNNYNILSL